MIPGSFTIVAVSGQGVTGFISTSVKPIQSLSDETTVHVWAE